MSNKNFSMTELLAQAAKIRQSEAADPKKSCESSATHADYFPTIDCVIGEWELKMIPNVIIEITKVSMFDKRSMTILYHPMVKSIDGVVVNEPLLNGLVSGHGNPEAVRRTLSLRNIVKLLKLDAETKKTSKDLLKQLEAVVEAGLELGETKRGYFDTTKFVDYYNHANK